MEGTSEKYEVVALPKHDSSSSLAALLPGEDGKAKLGECFVGLQMC